MELKLDLLDSPLRTRLWARKYLLSRYFGAWVRFCSGREETVVLAMDEFKLLCALRSFYVAYKERLYLKHSLSFAGSCHCKVAMRHVFAKFQDNLVKSRRLASAQTLYNLLKARQAITYLRLQVRLTNSLSSAIRCRLLKIFNRFRLRIVNLRRKRSFGSKLPVNLIILRKYLGN
jgi:hypothetical protein